MLDETTCPVCGKDLTAIPYANAYDARWAVAHYLAHLVQQRQPAEDAKRLIFEDATVYFAGNDGHLHRHNTDIIGSTDTPSRP